MLVAGVDGCRGGWLVVRAQVADRLRLVELSIAPTFEDLIANTGDSEAVAVDVPIGLTDGPPRQADIEARRVLGEPRRRSVFPSPIWPVLGAKTHEEAKELCLAACGKSVQIQAFSIMKKVQEANEAMSPALQNRVKEVHPEVSFWALNKQRPMAHKKKSAAGKEERRHLLADVFADDLAAVAPPLGAARDDFLDACVGAWTARRVAHKKEGRLPKQRLEDSHGLRMELVY